MSLTQSKTSRASRVARFLHLRDAILPYLECDLLIDPTAVTISIGSFLVRYSVLGWTDELWRNLQIWPPGSYQFGTHVHGNKVANVNWNSSDDVDLVTFRAGVWQEQLLDLLIASGSMTVERYGKSPLTGRGLKLTTYT